MRHPPTNLMTYLGKQGIYDQVKNATKHLIAHQNSEVEVGDNDGAVVLNAIGPMPRRRQGQTDHIKTEGESEEFPVEK